MTFSLKRFAMALTVVGVLFAFTATSAMATSQWSRKYGVSCVTCHSQFPRLNFYGDRFMRNGYQDPDESMADGDTKGKEELNERTFIDEIGNHLGLRLNLDVFRVQTNKNVKNGERKDAVTFGNPNWLQPFVAGSIFKNVSIFIEAEITNHGAHFSWYNLKFTNLADSSALNFQVGNLNPREWTSYSGRLRQFAPHKGPIFNVKSSNGKGEDSVNISSARPAIQYYGYTGPAFWFAGVTTGNEAPDPNNELHYWGGLRFEIPESMESAFEGSSISGWYYEGTDTANSAEEQMQSDFTRASIEANLRWNALDIQGVYVTAEDDNWNLDADKLKVDWDGVSFSGAWMTDSGWYPALAYDQVNSTKAPEIEVKKVVPSISYNPRENMRIGLYAVIDLLDNDGHTKSHDYRLNIRTMF